MVPIWLAKLLFLKIVTDRCVSIIHSSPVGQNQCMYMRVPVCVYACVCVMRLAKSQVLQGELAQERWHVIPVWVRKPENQESRWSSESSLSKPSGAGIPFPGLRQGPVTLAWAGSALFICSEAAPAYHRWRGACFPQPTTGNVDVTQNRFTGNIPRMSGHISGHSWPS